MFNNDSRRHSTDLARALGWFSIALGAAEIAAPSRLARVLGTDDSEMTRATLRAFGARELAAGVAILAQPHDAHRLWSRVGGDVLDLAWLGRSMRGGASDRLGIAAVAVAGVTALDVFTARRLDGGRRPARGRTERVSVEQVVTIRRSGDELYAFWRDFRNFPQFMKHVKKIDVLDDRRSRWTAKAPAGMSVHWDAEIVEDRESEWIAWRTLPGSQVEHRGSVRFTPAPGARGTEVRVQMEYWPPAGRVGRIVAMLFGEEPAQQIREDLRRFKQLAETGEIARSDGPGLSRAARPAKRAEPVHDYAEVLR